MRVGNRRQAKLVRTLAHGMIVSFICAGALSVPAASSSTNGKVAAENEVFGIWASKGTMIELSPGADGELSARIVALKNPHWRQKDGIGVVGEPKTDLHNPDESLRQRPLIGLEMLSGFRFHKGRWRGRLYLPTEGSNWASKAFVKNGQLQIHGYVGLPLLGRTQKFLPISACNKNILRMIRSSGLSDTPCDERLEEAQ